MKQKEVMARTGGYDQKKLQKKMLRIYRKKKV